MKHKELQEILRLHSLWVIGNRYGKEANLRGADLSGASLRGADLSGANLSGANLNHTDLSMVDLRGADLSVAYLRGADLSGASLSGANLSHTDLSMVDLSMADLRGASLRRADLSGSNLSGANLSGANLEWVVGVRVAACHWSGHGERGRQLLAVELPEGITFYCGCFIGSESDLRKYISAGNPEYKVSRRKALNFLRSCF